MKNIERTLYGLIVTIVIYAIATTMGSQLNLKNDFIPNSFIVHTSMLLLSAFAIYFMRKHMTYQLALPKFKKIFRPILFGVLTTILVNFFMNFATLLMGAEKESLSILSESSPLQILVFIFFYASVCEELLFRGFLMNFLKPLEMRGFKIFKRRLSLPVIISAVLFGLGHIIIVATGAGFSLVLRTVVFTTVLGLVAGYYQEKYENNAYAIIVHMSANSLVVISVLVLNAMQG